MGRASAMEKFLFAIVFVSSLTTFCFFRLIAVDGNRHDIQRSVRSIEASTVREHRAFVIVGAFRTLHHTHKTILANLVQPLCPADTCVAHLFLHLSHTDNRPNVTGNDPRGSLLSESALSNTTYFWQDASQTFAEHIRVHHVPGYDIGSLEEQSAHDILQAEVSPQARRKLRLLRFGDPRRFSMWASRAWAWRHLKQYEEESGSSFDFYAFLRPDLLWFLPVPSEPFISKASASSTQEEIWFHDTYFAMLPDTFMFTFSRSAASKYFSLEHLAAAACLGGPNFNVDKVKKRLGDLHLATRKKDWCHNGGVGPGGWGFSEVILRLKMQSAGVKPRYLPFGVALLRPPLALVCQPLRIRQYSLSFPFTFVPPFACEVLSRALKNRGNSSVSDLVLGNATRWQPYRWRQRQDSTSCLELGTNRTIRVSPCREPYPANQLFGGNEVFVGYLGGRLNPRLIKKVTLPNHINLKDDWVKEPCVLYSKRLMRPCESSLPGECNELDYLANKS